MLAKNVGFNSLDLAKYAYTIMFDICIKLLLRLALFGHLSTQFFPPMVFLIYSPFKPHIANLRHAHRCVTGAISRMSMEEKGGLVWILMYVFLFLSCWLLASGWGITWAQVKLQLTIQSKDSTQMVTHIKQSMFFPLDIVCCFWMVAKSGSWVVDLSNFKQNVRY